MADLLQFVDSIASSPSVRLNLNDGATWKNTAEGTSFPPPPLRRAVASTLLVDGGRVTAAAYDNRLLQLRLVLRTASADLQATQIQALARELDRPSNFLKWHPDGATNPVFFRTFRSDIAQLDRYLSRQQVHDIDLELLAEPFAYGLKETLSPVTVNNNPAAGSNGMFFDVTGIKGDVETPLHLVVAGSMVTNPNAGPRTSAIAVRRRGTPSSAPFLLQAESMTQGTDTTTQPNSALFSGSSNNFSRTTFASPTMFGRLSTTVFPGSAGLDVRGTYRVFVRYRFSTATSPVVNVRLLWGTAGGTATLITGDTVPLVGDNGGGAPFLKYADLGLVQMPPGYDPVTDGPSGTEIATEGIYVQLQAERTSGAASVDWDFLLFLPADDRTLLAKWPTASSAPTDLVLNSHEDQVYARNASGQVVSMPFARLAGGSPMVSPGVTNRVYFVRDVGPDTSTAGSGAGDDITATTAITPFYWPRYLYVRPAST